MQKFILFTVFIFSSHSSYSACLKTPASFDDNRIYLKVQGPKESVLFYTDSGGGLYPFVYKPTAEKLGMKLEKTIQDEGMEVSFSNFPAALEQQNIPLHPDWKSNVRVFTAKEGAQDGPSQIPFFV